MAGSKPGVHIVQLKPVSVSHALVEGDKFIKWEEVWIAQKFLANKNSKVFWNWKTFHTSGKSFSLAVQLGSIDWMELVISWVCERGKILNAIFQEGRSFSILQVNTPCNGLYYLSDKGPRTGNTERWHSDEIFSKVRQIFIFLRWIRICNQISRIRFQSPARSH